MLLVLAAGVAWAGSGSGSGSAALPPASFGHDTHATVPCTQCHGAKLKNAHAACAGCHAKTMSACDSCHVEGRAPPKVADGDLPLAYAHSKHTAPCAMCHVGLDHAAAGRPLPRAPLSACAGCHDGKTAFSTDAACTRCHSAAPAKPWTPAKPGPRFSHATHASAGRSCASCHALAASGEPAVARHEACTGAGCHVLHPDAANTTAAGEAKAICGACHEGTEPWRHLVADRAPPDATEVGATLDHGKHTAACTTCHSRRTPTSELRMPHGHAACSGAACHAVDNTALPFGSAAVRGQAPNVGGGPAPSLTACDGCHRTGLAAERSATRLAAPWSVRAAYGHALHDARAKLACADCHTALAGAQLLALPTPAKAACAPCHDGRTAFKLTGTTCRRCHK